MKEILDYFEDLDEAVYISDMMTHDLVYMNPSLRSYLNHSSCEQHSGKKCYELLHGRTDPCPFCNNDQLKDQNWISWIYTTPNQDKQFLVKDRMIHYNGNQYRIEVSLDIAAASSFRCSHPNTIYDAMINDCLQKMFATNSSDESINQLLAYVGTKFRCERVYIFELHGQGFVSDTYEWCAEGAVPQKEILQKEPVECVDWWLEKFRQNDIVLIEDVEALKTKHPTTYAVLKPQGVHALAAVPIRLHNEICGFVGVDNPSPSMMRLMRPLLAAIEQVITMMFRRRELFDRLEQLSFHDHLTGALNRNALVNHFKDTSKMHSMGVLYFDISGLQRTNDSLGHEAGDFMIRSCFHYIHHLLKDDHIYRIGGDEFVFVRPDCSIKDFGEQLDALKEKLQTYRYHIALGGVWSDTLPLNCDELTAKACKEMVRAKRKYYAQKSLILPVDLKKYPIPQYLADINRPEQFISVISHNADAFFRSIAENNHSSYFYFGDIQKNIYYLSDNLRNDFGFSGNIVPNFLYIWTRFLGTANFRKVYLNKLHGILKGNENVLDFRYMVRDANGKALWVHNYGVVTRDESSGVPLFFSGRITHQEDSFVVDPVTRFPRASILWEALEGAETATETYSVIGFRFNHITEINNIHGRKYVDQLLMDIASQLLDQLSDKMSFYRSEGIRCIAVVRAQQKSELEALIRQIRGITRDAYLRQGLIFPHPCSVAVLDYSHSEMTIDEFRNNLEALVCTAKHSPALEYVQGTAESPQAMKNRSEMELALNRDVMHGMENFRVVIQPAVSAAHGGIKGGEVLLRWKFQGKDVSPAVFIPILEKSSMIHIAGRWVFEQTARVCSRIVSYFPNFYLSFNVSLYQLADKDLPEFMQKTLDKYHLDGSHLVVEITESCLDKQPELLMLFIQACKKIGLQLAMDDFGSGYSSLRMLLQYPYNIIKLDRSLLQEITVSEESRSFIRNLVCTCHNCNKQVCVEGVETEEENAIVSQTACDTIQGYYHHKPMELKDIYNLINTIKG